MSNYDPCNRQRISELRRISPYNGYNFDYKDSPHGFNASEAPIFMPKRNPPKYYHALNNMKNSVDYVKNQENFEYDFKKHLKETGKQQIAGVVLREYAQENEKLKNSG